VEKETILTRSFQLLLDVCTFLATADVTVFRISTIFQLMPN